MKDDDSFTSIDPASSHESSSDSEPQAINDGSPWGFWATAGFAFVVFGAFLLIQIAISIPFVISIMAENPGIGEEQLKKALEQNGLLVSIATTATGILCPALIVLIAWFRRGITVRDYLALTRPPYYRSLLGWLAFAAGLVAVSDGLTFLLGRDIVPEFMPEVYSTSKFPPLLWVAVLLMAPLFEEFFFRGFLFAGWSRSKLGVTGTIVLTSILWASIHLQYGYFYIAMIFVFGIFLGLARHRTRSLIVPIAIHGLMNLIATIQAMFM